MPRTPKALSPTKSTREKLARASKDRPKTESPSPTKVKRSSSPKKTPTKEKSSPKKEKSSPKKEKSSPKKEKTVKSPKKSTPSKYNHPTYEIMIRRAIKEDATRKGTSYAAIYKFVDANFQVPATYQTHVRNNLKKLLEDGTLLHGSTTHRYKLSPKARLEDKKEDKKKETPKKSPKKEKKTDSPKKSSKSSKSEDSPKKKKKSSKSEDSPKKKTPKKSPKKEPKSPKKETKRSPSKSPKRTTKESSSPAKSTRSASSKKVSEVVKKATSKRTSKAASSPKTPRGGVKKPLSKKKEKKTPPPKTPRGSAKKASPLSSPSRDASASASGELKWVWQYYDNGFYNYSGNASDVVEGVYQEYLSSPYTTDVRSVKSGQWSYLVDFREMTQQNVEHESHTKRKIRRVQIPLNQVSDLKKKYDDNADDSGSD